MLLMNDEQKDHLAAQKQKSVSYNASGFVTILLNPHKLRYTK